MSHSVDIRLSDDACAATIERSCELINVTVSDDASLVITDDASNISDDKKIVFLGSDAPQKVAAHFTLPLSLESLLQRIKQLAEQPDRKITAGDVTLDMAKRQLAKAAAVQELTDKESQLLMLLMEKVGDIIPKDTLLHEVWSYHPDIDTHTLETHIYRLRGKCSALGSILSIEAKDGGYVIIV